MSSVTINIAKDVGFCLGVRRALKIARESLERYGKVAMLGDIVHNEAVIRDLNNAGIKVYQKLSDVPLDIPVLFRSHGTPREVWEEAQRKGYQIIDATCPLVREIHRYASILEDDDRRVIIIGDRSHDEIRAIASLLHDPIVIATPAQAEKLTPLKRAGVVMQSTQFIDDVKAVIAVLHEKVTDLRIINTICAPTRERQNQVKLLATRNDVMVIVGSEQSANTNRLAKIGRRLNPRTYRVDNGEELKPEWFRGCERVGISAGASTPGNIVEEVAKKITKMPL